MSSSSSSHDWMDLQLDDMSLEMEWEQQMLREALGLLKPTPKKTDGSPERKEKKLKRSHEKSMSPESTPERSPTPESPKTYPTAEEKEDTDSRSVYVGNLDWYSSSQDVEDHFRKCGEVVRVTIPIDKVTRKQKNYAYVEFSRASSVERALQLTGSSIRDRQILVTSKRTNLPGMSEPSRAHKSSSRHGTMYSDKPRGSYIKDARRTHGSSRGADRRAFKPYN